MTAGIFPDNRFLGNGNDIADSLWCAIRYSVSARFRNARFGHRHREQDLIELFQDSKLALWIRANDVTARSLECVKGTFRSSSKIG